MRVRPSYCRLLPPADAGNDGLDAVARVDRSAPDGDEWRWGRGDVGYEVKRDVLTESNGHFSHLGTIVVRESSH